MQRVEYQFRPIERYPVDETQKRRRSKFDFKYSRLIDDLAREMRYLKATQIIIQGDFTHRDIRNDGMLRSDARQPTTPRIILSFNSKIGPLSYPCDTYIHWQDNLRAIVLSLGALRAVDRHGVTRRSEQYKGWAKLPAPDGADSIVTINDAAEWLATNGEGEVDRVKRDREYMNEVYRRSAHATHSDKGGDDESFKKTQRAKEVLDRHFNGAEE